MNLEDDAVESRMFNLCFYILYWELGKLLPAVDGDDDASWKRRLFREELANFHELVINNVTHNDFMVHVRDSLRLAWQDCIDGQEDVSDENWTQFSREDVKVGVLNDLQRVAPGIWIGSSETLEFTDLLDERDIQHLVYCTTTPQESKLIHKNNDTSPPWSNYVAELFELPRQRFEDIMICSDGLEQLNALSFPSCNTFANIASELGQIIGTNSQANGPRKPGNGGMLLYCDSGISTSIAMCALLLMTRYELSLEHVMPLIRAARRDISISKHLQFQLEHGHSTQRSSASMS
ncbi:unnamed protein product [Phytophthora fragariaefolia]|uniref:Unnamed protein product n=1 Tax=Phytophthora fragariaefolia TaxID=1490495 RepID=A0A9W7D649_9STRA|nr:unnamed protein product [Phytophthora fragariaefolia]